MQLFMDEIERIGNRRAAGLFRQGASKPDAEDDYSEASSADSICDDQWGENSGELRQNRRMMEERAGTR
jgi:hypothetical protein